MIQVETPLVRYIFLDIVSFTQGRSVEAQADLVSHSNRIIADVLTARLGEGFRENESIIVLPTGDGVCIALIDLKPFDIHMQIAMDILQQVSIHNSQEVDESRRFQFRVGVNQNEDTLVTDVNGRKNVAGSGINIAQRVMSMGEGGHILLGQPVYDILSSRQAYMNSIEKYDGIDKHGNRFPVYQYFDKGKDFINSYVPSVFEKKKKEFYPIDDFVAYFMCYSLKNREFLFARKNEAYFDQVATVLLYLLSVDKIEEKSLNEYDDFYPSCHSGSFEEQYDYYIKVDQTIMGVLFDYVHRNKLSHFVRCFEEGNFYRNVWPIVSELGERRLKSEKPAIFNEFFEGAT